MLALLVGLVSPPSLAEATVIGHVALRGSVYQQLPVAADGTRRSEAFVGLWLDVAALLRGDLQAVRARLDEGIATEEHRAFVRGLDPGGRGGGQSQ